MGDIYQQAADEVGRDIPHFGDLLRETAYAENTPAFKDAGGKAANRMQLKSPALKELARLGHKLPTGDVSTWPALDQARAAANYYKIMFNRTYKTPDQRQALNNMLNHGYDTRGSVWKKVYNTVADPNGSAAYYTRRVAALYPPPPPPPMIPKQSCDKNWKTLVGKAGGLKLCVVDGNHIRTCIGDVDFALGGNHERYPYIPDDEVWAEDTNDLFETFGHEIAERALMKKGGTYENSHKIALAWEMAVRGVTKSAKHQEVDNKALSKRASFEGWMRKQAEPPGTAFDSRAIPDIRPDGSGVNPNPTRPEPKEIGLQRMPKPDNQTTSDEDDNSVAEPRSPGSSDGGGGAGP